MISATVTGRIGKDAETRAAGKDTVTSFSVASDSRAGKEKTTNWVDCSIWGKRGEGLKQYLSKGQPVTVIGELTTREHAGKTYIGIRVDHIELQGKSGGSSSGGGSSSSQNRAPDPVDNSGSGDDSDEIPFVANVSCEINEAWWRW